MFTTGIEITTAVTDLINGLISLIPFCWCLRKKPFTKRNKLWAAGFGMLALVSIFGFILHGFVKPDILKYIFYCVEYCLMTFMLSSYVTAIKYDLDGETGLIRYKRICMIIGAFIVVLLAIMKYYIPRYAFVVFSLYCLAYLIYSVIRLFQQVSNRPAFKWYLTAIFVLIAASIIQSIKSIEFTFIWTFNYNSVYHVMTLIFMLIQFKGFMIMGEREYPG